MDSARSWFQRFIKCLVKVINNTVCLETAIAIPLHRFKFADMEHTRRSMVADLLKSKEFGKEVLVKGWVRTRRGNKQVNFIALNDGSIVHHIQVVAEVAAFDESLLKRITTGSAIAVKGILVPSPGQEQAVEIHAKEIILYGTADPETYPLQKKEIGRASCRERV